MKINFTEMDGMLGIKKMYGNAENIVKSVTYDSRRVTADSAFVCIKGEHHDGHAFIEQVLEQGATVIIGDSQSELEKISRSWKDRSFIVVSNVKSASARLSSLVYGNAEKKLDTIAVTGTNGKTTVAAFVRSLLNLLGVKTSSIGTLGVISSRGKIQFQKSTPTTPEAPDLHYLFHHFYFSGEQAVAMEVSSIAMEERRVEGILFDVGIHTNLSPEHLEYHHDFASYKQAKLKMFNQVKRAVVNLDDDGMAAEILKTYSGPVITYSMDSHSDADLIVDEATVTSQGSELELRVKGSIYRAFTSVVGGYNLANLLAAIGAVIQLGFSIKHILPVLSRIETPEGRFQIIKTETNRTVVLDYAHTPVALNNVLTEVKKLPHKRLIALITGIGIRDFEKMPRMAATAENRADEIVVSVDHPGFHDPQAIVDQVMTGFSNPSSSNIHRALTRREGVLTALSLAEEGDLILLTSGCINGCQIVKGEYIPHSDEAIIKEYCSGQEAGFRLSGETGRPERNTSR